MFKLYSFKKLQGAKHYYLHNLKVKKSPSLSHLEFRGLLSHQVA